jgi:hypothetical protein
MSSKSKGRRILPAPPHFAKWRRRQILAIQFGLAAGSPALRNGCRAIPLAFFFTAIASPSK